ncbi:MAG: C39 family peptidase [Deltaproteobacteria bacterium]|nr:C39 family peptidase [Deltaproteobacteria bacterium]
MERYRSSKVWQGKKIFQWGIFLGWVLLFIVSCAAPHLSIKADAVPRLSEVRNLIRLPLIRQATDYTCAVAALQSVLYYYGEEFREDQLAKALESTPENGTDYRRIVRFATERGYQVEVLSDISLQDLQSMIDRKIPMIVALQAWAEQAVNWETSFEEGHYAVVVGYDRKNMYFMDPSTLGHYTFIPTSEFLRRWHDKHTDGTILNRFGIVISKDRPYYDAEVILYMK